MFLYLAACAPSRVEMPQEWRNVDAMLADGLAGKDAYLRAGEALRRLSARYPQGHPWREVAEVRAAWLSLLSPADLPKTAAPKRTFSLLPSYSFLLGDEAEDVRRVDEHTIEWRRGSDATILRSDDGFRAAVAVGDVLYTLEGVMDPPQPKCCTLDYAERRVLRRSGDSVVPLATWQVDRCNDRDDYSLVVGTGGFAVIHDGWAGLYSEDGATSSSVRVGNVLSVAERSGQLITVGEDGAVLVDLAKRIEVGRRPIASTAAADPERGLVWTWDGTAWPVAPTVPGTVDRLTIDGAASITGDTLYYAAGKTVRARNLVDDTDSIVDLPGWSDEVSDLRALPDGRLVVSTGYGSGEVRWLGHPGQDPEAVGPYKEVEGQPLACEVSYNKIVNPATHQELPASDGDSAMLGALCCCAETVEWSPENVSFQLPRVVYTFGPDGLMLRDGNYEYLLPRVPRGSVSSDGRWSVENNGGSYQLVSTLAGSAVSFPIGGVLVTSGFSSDGQWWYTLDEEGLLRKIPLNPSP